MARRWVTKEECAEYLRCCRRTVAHLIATGKVKGYRLGKKMVLLDLSEVDEYVLSTDSTRAIEQVHRPVKKAAKGVVKKAEKVTS